MNSIHRARILIIASAALGFATISSSASAQPTEEDYCTTYAWNVCSYGPGGMPTVPSQQCLTYEYNACMGIHPANLPSAGDRLPDTQLATRLAAPTRL